MFPEVKKQVEENGFAVIENFLTPEEIEDLKNETNKLIDTVPESSRKTIFSTTNSETLQNKDTYFLESADKISFFFEEGSLDSSGSFLVDKNISLNKIGHALHKHNSVFRKVTFSQKVKEIAVMLGFEDPVIAQSMYIFKNPGIGSEVIAHQDAWYLYAEPLMLAGFWIALDDATIENGCLWISKGSHKSGVHKRLVRNSDKKSEELLVYTGSSPVYQRNTFSPVKVPKGTCVIIHGKVVHFSEQNRSDKSRHAYTFHVLENKNIKYCENNWLQPNPESGFMHLYEN